MHTVHTYIMYTYKHSRPMHFPWWVQLSGMASLRLSARFPVTLLALSIVFSRPFFLTRPGLGAPLRSYLEGALYKFMWLIDLLNNKNNNNEIIIIPNAMQDVYNVAEFKYAYVVHLQFSFCQLSLLTNIDAVSKCKLIGLL